MKLRARLIPKSLLDMDELDIGDDIDDEEMMEGKSEFE